MTAVTKLIHSDKVDILVNGASSAGNLAVSPLAARASLPLLIQGLLPKKDSPEYKWTFTTYPPFVAEIAPRFEYLSQKTNVKKVGVLYDPTPYSRALNKVGAKVAAKNGITVVGEQQFKFSDTDLSVHIKKLVAAGAEAIIRNGVGPATIVAAKNMKELNIKVPMIATIDDLSVQRAASGAIGTQLLFVGTPGPGVRSIGQRSPVEESHRGIPGRLETKVRGSRWHVGQPWLGRDAPSGGSHQTGRHARWCEGSGRIGLHKRLPADYRQF